ncbi:hypothetical protein AB0D04_34995 [Streptomyces sp. NPDC048483]|uniref:hypothetical protein n=1 Tax=Streptomyces sp. NPDC048483 TaxID=3154927 RepID=UPI00343E8834
MRIRTTLFAVTLATAALLGSAATAAADDGADPGSRVGADVSDAPMGKDPMRGESQGKVADDSSLGELLGLVGG